LVPLTVAQVRAWAEHAPPRVQAMIAAQAGLGLRISEARALRVEDVEFLRHEVRIEAQLDDTGRRVPLKTGNSRRTIPLPTVTAQALAAHLEAFPAGADGLIFTSRGQPWPLSSLRRPYASAAAAAGLPAGTTSHALRHHYASVQLAAGASVPQVAEWLGNTPEMVLDVYGHVMPDQADTARRNIDQAWAAEPGQLAGEAGSS
jgi:integrase